MIYRKAGQLAIKIEALQQKQNQKAKIYFKIFTDPHGENQFPVSSTIPVNWCNLKQERLKRLLHNSLNIFSTISQKLLLPTKQIGYIIR